MLSCNRGVSKSVRQNIKNSRCKLTVPSYPTSFAPTLNSGADQDFHVKAVTWPRMGPSLASFQPLLVQLEGLTGSPLIDSQWIVFQQIDLIPPVGRKPRQYIVSNLEAFFPEPPDNFGHGVHIVMNHQICNRVIASHDTSFAPCSPRLVSCRVCCIVAGLLRFTNPKNGSSFACPLFESPTCVAANFASRNECLSRCGRPLLRVHDPVR